jgi:hypothetical protein
VRLIDDAADVPVEVRRMILQHHERVDGRGYPLGLSDRELLVESKMLAIVDSYHAMVGRRGYRAPMSPSEAARVILCEAGRQFDADLAARWSGLVRRFWTPLRPGQQASGDDGDAGVAIRHEHAAAPRGGPNTAPRARRLAPARPYKVACINVARLPGLGDAPAQFQAEVVNLSSSGACIRCDRPMFAGEVVSLCLDRRDPHSWFRGGVAWCKRQTAGVFHVGLHFLRRLRADEAARPHPVLGPSEQGVDPALLAPVQPTLGSA